MSYNIRAVQKDLNQHARPVRACLHGGGGPQVGEVAPSGRVTRLSI